MISTAWRKPSTSKVSSSLRNFSRLRLARLHAELSRCMYSEQGLLPLMRPVLAAVCHRLMVVSNCMPGSAHSHAASQIWRNSSRALTVRTTLPVVTSRRLQSPSSTTACMNSSVTRTELLAFWYWIEWLSRPSRSMSKPACSRTRALRSSSALHQTNSWMSGWSMSRMTILAARRVLPPDLMVPADASAPRMKLTGPDAVPPPRSSSADERMRDRFTPAPEPPLKMMPSSRYQLRIESIESSTERMKHALACWGTPLTPMLNQTGLLNAAFWATMLVAFNDHETGNSTSRFSKATDPSRKLVMRASRRSHSMSSYGWTPSVVNCRRRPMPACCSGARAMCSSRSVGRAGWGEWDRRPEPLAVGDCCRQPTLEPQDVGHNYSICNYTGQCLVGLGWSFRSFGPRPR